MIRWRTGKIVEIIRDNEDLQEVEVETEERRERALSFPHLLGAVGPGDTVVLNTTALRLGLGTGGYHFVAWVMGRQPPDRLDGHIMKLRYTPLQVVCPSVEAQESPHHSLLKDASEIPGMPVVVAALHSHVGPAAAGVKALKAGLRVAYVMTDGGALPIAVSDSVRSLRGEGLIDLTITVGHAFGGDIEAVSLHSGLAAAREVGKADVAIVSIGPGIVGTGTPLGNTALSQGEALNAVLALRGIPLAVPRIGFGDPRPRHRGVSHHTLTVLGRIVLGRCLVVLPSEARHTKIPRILWREGIAGRHQVILGEGAPAMHLLEDRNVQCKSMGRAYRDDPLFFLAAGAAGSWAARLTRRGKEA